MTRKILILTAFGLLSACETVGGFGEDVQIAGEAIQEEASAAQN